MKTAIEEAIVVVQTQLGPLEVDAVGAGPAVILWHSLFVDRRSFAGLLDALSPRHRVICIDAPDHGRSPGPSDRRAYDLDDCADAALAVLDALQVDTADWVGHAWGGHVGMVLAARRTGRLRSATAIASPMQPVEGRLRLQVLMMLHSLIGIRGPVASGVVDAMLDPSKRDAARIQMLLNMARTPSRASLSRALRSVMLGRLSLLDRLGSIDIPTLFVTGDDPMWPPELAYAQARPIPHHRVEHLPGTRHLQPLEDPRGLAGVLLRWLAEVGRGTDTASPAVSV